MPLMEQPASTGSSRRALRWLVRRKSARRDFASVINTFRPIGEPHVTTACY